MAIAMSKQFQYVIGCTTCKKTKSLAISNLFANGLPNMQLYYQCSQVNMFIVF